MKKSSVFSSRAFRKGTLSIVLTAVVIVAVLLVNVLATAVSQRYPFSVDLTANKDYTISLTEEYESFVKNIDMDVEMTICAAKDDFNNSGYASAMVQTLSLTDYYAGISESTTKYARQVSTFMQAFSVLNPKITVTFANPNSVTEFASISSKYTSDELSYGDIIISCQHPSTSGETFERYQIVKMNDIFTVEATQDTTYYGMYEITGSSLAGEIISRLYIVTNDSSVEVAVLGGHNVNSEYSDMLTGFLKKNNYTFTNVNNLLKDQIKEDTKMAILAAPTNDYTADEIKVLDSFLKNNGNYGRTLLYLPSCSQPELPLLEEFLAEWGIQILPAISYEEDENNYYQYPQWVMAQAADSEYTKGFDSAQQYFYPMNYRLAKTLFESQGGYFTTKILTTGENAYGYPISEEVPEDWKPADAKYKGQFDLVVMSTYQHADSATSVAGESHVVVMGGDFFFYDEIMSSTACYNSTLTLNMMNGLTGQDSSINVSIEDKVISTTSFFEQILNSNAGIVVMVVFVAVLPLSLVVLSFVIWRRRKKK